MNVLKNLLRHPLKDTTIFFCITLLLFSILFFIGSVLGRYVSRDYVLGIENNHFITLMRVAVWELVFLAKLALEVTSIILVGQIIYRFLKK